MISIQDFCDQHRACEDGRDWLLANCADMLDAWHRLKPDWLIWVATRPGVLTDQELRLFAVFCARQVEHLLADQRSKDAIDVAERFAKGEATIEELTAAWSAAGAAARALAWAAAGAAAWNSARAAARAAAWCASEAAAGTAWSTAEAAAWNLARAEAADEAWDAQAEWLRDNTTPNFGVEVTQ